MFKLDLEETEEPEIKHPTSAGSSKKRESSRKTSTSASLTMLKPLTVLLTMMCGKFCSIDYAKAFDCVDHNKLEKFSRDGNTRPPYLPPEKSVFRSRSNS